MPKGLWYLILSKTIWHGPNMLMDILDRTKCVLVWTMDIWDRMKCLLTRRAFQADALSQEHNLKFEKQKGGKWVCTQMIKKENIKIWGQRRKGQLYFVGPRVSLFGFYSEKNGKPLETFKLSSDIKRLSFWASLVAQWLRVCLPMQGTQVQSLVWENPTCSGATKPMRHNYWVHASQLLSPHATRRNYLSPCALGPACHYYWAHVLQLLKPVCLEPVFCNKRNHRNENPAHHNEE